MSMRIAIIGAGISGITLARELHEKAQVIVFEKSRGVGGRMSTRNAEPFYFDHGAQYFTVRTKRFRAFLKPYMETGLVADWNGKVINLELGKKVTKRLWFEPHLVAAPGMNSLCKKLAEHVDIKLCTEVAPLLERQTDGWHLEDKDGVPLGVYDIVISTAPPAQTIRLFEAHLPQDTALHRVQMQGCYSLMIGFKQAWQQQWIAAKVNDNPIQWVSINSTKPGRNNDVTCIVAQSHNSWADTHINDDLLQTQTFLLEQFQQVTGIDCTHADYISTHRWKYAIVSEAEKSEPYFNSDKNLGSVSDWNSKSRIEECWLNAMQLAEQINH